MTGFDNYDTGGFYDEMFLPAGTFQNTAEQHLGQLRAELAYIGVQQILHQGLHEFLDALQTKLNLVGDGIFETFFALRPIGGTER